MYQKIDFPHIRAYFLSILITLMMFSCATVQKKQISRKDKKLQNISDLKLYQEVKSKYLDFETLYMKKVAVQYTENGKKQSLRCNLRIKKDSIIWLSASKMGIEGMRIKLTPDSIFIIDRLDKSFFKGNYNYINNRLNLDLDFFIIQSILTNRLPEYGTKKNKLFHKNFQGKKSNTGKYIFYSKGARPFWRGKVRNNKRNAKTIEFLEIAPDIMRVEQINICESSGIEEENCRYTQFYLQNKEFTLYDNKYLFPQKVEISGGCSNVFQKEFKVESINNIFQLDIQINSLMVNKENLNFPFSISPKYKQIYE